VFIPVNVQNKPKIVQQKIDAVFAILQSCYKRMHPGNDLNN